MFISSVSPKARLARVTAASPLAGSPCSLMIPVFGRAALSADAPPHPLLRAGGFPGGRKLFGLLRGERLRFSLSARLC